MVHQRTRERATRVLGAGISLILLSGLLVVFTATPAQAAPALTIENTSWHVYPWQKGNKSSLANRFPISARVCNTGDSATGPITVTMNHNLNPTVRIAIEAASIVSPTSAQQFLPSIAPPDPAKNETRVCRPVFFSFTATAQTTPSSSGQGAYTLSATDGTVTSNTTPSRTVWLQTMNQSNRNKMANTATAAAITHDMPCAAGTCTVRKGQTYNFVLRGAGPSGSSAQRQSYITFPANIFRIDKVTSTYSSHPTLNIDGIYADACGWNPATRKCVGPANISGGVIGGKVIRVKYKVTIIGTGSLSPGASGITGIIYDHNGSTYHVNGDSGTGGLSGTLTATTSADLRMNLSRTTSFQRGSTGSYTLSVTNNGSDPTSGNTTVTVTLPTGLTFNAAGTSAGAGWAATPCTAVGQTVTCTHSGVLTPTGSPPTPVTSTNLVLGVNASSGAATTVTTTASVSNSVVDPNTSNNTASDLTVTAAAGEADLVLTNAHVGTFSRGATGSYTLTVRNNGPAAASGPLTVTDTLPSGLTYQSFSSGVLGEWDCSADGQTVTCTRSSGLAANTTAAAITVNVSVDEGAADSVTNTASVVANGTVDPYSPNNLSVTDQTDIGSADLEARLWTTGQFAIPASGTTTGTVYLNFKNLGPHTANGPVTATVTLPAGLTYSSFSSDSASWTACSGAGQVVTCTRTGSLATGATTSDLGIHVTVAAGTAEGVLDAMATITGPTSDPDLSNNTAEASVAMYFGVSLTVNVTASGTTSDGGTTTTVAAGTSITYTIVTTNNGPSAATDVYWIDTLPPGWTGIVGTITPGNGKSGTLDCDVDDATLTKPGEVYCNIGDIPSGASVTSTIVIPTTTSNPQTLVNTVLVDMTQANTATNVPPATQTTTTLTGGNPVPVVTITSSATTVTEHGTTQSNYAWTATDNSGTVSSVETSCGAGGVKVTSPAETIAGNNQSGNFNCTFPDGPLTSDVTVIAVDPSNVSGSNTRTVTIDNVAPTGTFNAPATVNAGDSFTLSATDATDVSSIDVTAGLTFSFDCGAGYGEFGTAGVTCPGVAAGSQNVAVRIRDKDGATTEYTDSITVVGSGPVITWDAGNDYSPAEHSTTARTFNFSAADTNGLSPTVTASCGTGGDLVADSATIDTGTGAGSFACVFGDGPATPTISVTVADGLSNNTTDTQGVTVANVAPTVTVTGDAAATESSVTTHRYDFTVTDPAGVTADPPTISARSCGSSGTEVLDSYSFNATAGVGSFLCHFSDGPASSTVSVDASDGDTGTDSDTLQVTVANVAPTVAFTGGSTAPAVGIQTTYTYSISDPGDDTVTSVSTSCDGGTKADDTNDSTAGSFKCTFSDLTARTLTAQATDSDGDAGNTATRVVSPVTNAGPTVTWDAGNDYSATEHATTIRTFNFTAADGDGLAPTVTASCGTGGSLVTDSPTIDTGTGAGSFACVFADGPATPTISVTVTDGLGNDTTDTQDVTVANVAPTVTVTGDGAGVVGVAESFSYAITDPGDDTYPNSGPDDRTIACGTGGTVSSETGTATGGTFACTYASSGAKTVTVTVHDSDGAEGSDTEAMTITANAGPVITWDAGNDNSAAEHSTTERAFLYSAGDVDGIPLQTPVIDCGIGGVAGTNSFNVISGAGWFTCVFADGPAAPEISVSLDDSLGNTGSATQTITVANVAPTVTVSSDGAGVLGVAESFSYTITDPGDDSFPDGDPADRTIACGTDGTVSNETATAAGGTFSCTYSSSGAKSVTVTVDDSDGEEGSDSEVMTITANTGPVITWDPSNDYSADEHATTVRTFNFDAADTDGLAATMTTSCGTGGALVTDSATIDTGTGEGSFGCVFADGPATPAISVTVGDDLGNDTTDTQGVTVANVAPTVTVGGDGTGVVAIAESFSYSITDPGDDTFPNSDPNDRTIACGTNGTPSNETATATGGAFQCTYSTDGAKTVTVTVHDSDGAESSDSDAQTISAAAPGPLVTSTDGAATTGDKVSPADPLQAAVQSDADVLSELDGLGKGLEITLDKEDPTVTITEDEHVQVDIQVEIHIREFDKDSEGAKIPGTEADYAADSYERAFTFDFLIDGALIPPGVTKEEIRVYRTSGGSTVEVRDCDVPIDGNDDLPCMFDRDLDGDTGDVTLTIKTLGASLWNFVVPTAAASEPDPPSGGGGGGSPSPSPSASPTPEPTVSPVAPLPRPLVRIRLSDSTPKRGTLFTIKTRLAHCPGHENTMIQLRRMRNGEWIKIDEKRLDETCHASWRLEADFRTRSYRTIWPHQDDDHRRGRSLIRTVTPHGRLPGPRIKLFVDQPTPVRGDVITFRTRLERCAGLEGDRVQLWRLVPGLTKADASDREKLLVMADGVYRKLRTKRVDGRCHTEFRMTADFTTATFRTIWPKQDPRYRRGRAEPVVVRTLAAE